MQTVSTASAPSTRTQQARKPRTPRPKAIPYPELPDTKLVSSAVFWRAAWLRDVAERAALKQHLNAIPFERWLRMPEPLRHALGSGESHLAEEARKSFKHLVEAGGLLFAWIPE